MNACLCTIKDAPLNGVGRKDKKMNSQSTMKENYESTTSVETPASDIDTLTQSGFSADESVSLLWLRQHYQSGGSDRAEVLRHWEFLKLLVTSGRMDVKER